MEYCAEKYIHYSELDRHFQSELMETVADLGAGYIRIKKGEPTICVLRGSCIQCPNNTDQEVVNG